MYSTGLTCDQPDGEVQHDDVGSRGADGDAEGGEDRAHDGDHPAAVTVDQRAGDRPDTQGDPHQDGRDEGDGASTLPENVHQFDQKRSE